MFSAILIEDANTGRTVQVRQLDDSQLPEGDVTVDVLYSTLNYKDGLAISGRAPVVRRYPMVPGIDLVGQIKSSGSSEFKPGQLVLLNGWGVGENHWGGLSQRAQLSSRWLTPLPAGITPRQSMAIGTAGYTAMLCILALERNGLRPEHGDVLVTGASGGVGSYAISLMSQLGYRVVAATGRPEEADYLKQLGASDILHRESLSQPGKPLQRELWAAAIDSVGGVMLANVCAGIKADGAVAACGMAASLDFPGSVAPFILRGINLLGINSVTRPAAERVQAWKRLESDINLTSLDLITEEISLGEAIGVAEQLMRGQIRGRVVVDVNRA
ncbi:acrylyl-CoA reductase (NADPH) [Ottowia thiooxydans]|uniref:Acrylyl-CoA reductase (NADPH) n=1 Tax=Ottowia thiooxydans TaxID=219182 RepID=A0ABV2Q910_9BURK